MSFDNLAKIKYQLQKGDNRYLEELFLKESDFCIKNLIRTTDCPKEEAEDIFVEAVMDFRQRIISEKLTAVDNVRNYLYTTCKNMWFNRLKKKKSQEKKHHLISDFLYEELEDDPITTMENLEEEQKLISLSQQSFTALGQKCQDILYFYYVESYAMKDIAKAMGLANANVVKVMKHRCLKQLVTIAKDLYYKVTHESR